MIKNLTSEAAATAVTAVTAVLRKVVMRAPRGWPAPRNEDDPGRWHVVTVNRSLEELADGVPEPLADMGDAVEVRLRPAPGDKGTEVMARLIGGGAEMMDGEEPVRALRSALRRAKQVAEVGWVLEPDRQTTTRPTPLNAPLRQATKHARGEGRL